MIFARTSPRPASVRDSYIEISRFIHGRSVIQHPSATCHNWPSTSEPQPTSSLRNFHTYTARRSEAEAAPAPPVEDPAPAEENGLDGENKKPGLYKGISQANRQIIRGYWRHRFQNSNFSWRKLAEYNSQLNKSTQKEDEQPSGLIRLHGYVTGQRKGGPTLSFGGLADPSLRYSVQLIHQLELREKTPDSEGNQDSEVIRDSEAKNDGEQDAESPSAEREELAQAGSFKSKESKHHAAVRRLWHDLRPHTPVLVVGHVQRKALSPVQKQNISQHGHLDMRALPDAHVGSVDRLANLEISLQQIFPLNEFPADVVAKASTVFPAEKRHLQFRTDRALRDRIRWRSRMMALARKSLFIKGFDEIETPLLFKSTPEGAREFIVPTRHKGLAYALPQSPQQYKQLLMASGFAKYFQFAKCFRDEDNRADRQPEFTQLDLEMAFADSSTVMNVIEKLLLNTILPAITEEVRPSKHTDNIYVFKDGSAKLRKPVDSSKIPVFSYNYAMNTYGSDKPDLRVNAKIHRVDHWLPESLKKMLTSLEEPIIDMLKVSMRGADPKKSRDFVTWFMGRASSAAYSKNPDGMPGITVFDSSKPMGGLATFGHDGAARVDAEFRPRPGDILIIQARQRKPLTGGSTVLGDIRKEICDAAIEAGIVKPDTPFEMCWVNDFPLFTKIDEGDGGNSGLAGICSTHHPFTAPLLKTKDSLTQLLQDPLSVKGDHFDLVINGVEVGGGSTRIHDAAMQEMILRDVLKLTPERIEDFRHLLNALKDGCPPHAGFAIGFDRLMSVLLGTTSVRDVIAFPKDGQGQDRFVDSPSALTQEQLNTYHLSLAENADELAEPPPKVSAAA